MIRMSKLTDYGIVLLAQLAGRDCDAPSTARDLASATHLPLPVVSKLLKALAREGILESHRGARGGYCLARDPELLTVAEIIRLLEGPIALTECGADPGACSQEGECGVRAPWLRINDVIQRALERVTLAELCNREPGGATPARGGALLGVGPATASGGLEIAGSASRLESRS
jgi:FeS assembly SUF system regulator